jgi:hypothetical protein
MPLKNHFRHQRYHADEPTAPWRSIKAEFPVQPDDDSFNEVCQKFDQTVAERVDAIWFLHGTFAGDDAFGWFNQVERLVPAAGSMLKGFGKKLTDLLAGDSGNYTPAFVELFRVKPATHRFVWSGENTHSGRCKAAVELLDQLLQRVGSESRVLLWSHSHAANVVALITNLLGAETWVQQRFFGLVEPLFHRSDDRMTALSRVRAAIEEGLGKNLVIDVLAFGSPVSYGWESAGYRKLMHIVNHVPIADSAKWLCPAVEVGKGIRSGIKGDLVQVLGITGSDFLPWLLNQKTRSVEKELAQFLAPDLSRRDWWSRASLGMRVADEGETILVQYDNTDGHATQTLGHSVYTKPQWLSFHMNLVSELYG